MARAAPNGLMRNCSTAGWLSLILLAGCAAPQPESPEFGAVPGPSQTKAALPPPAVAPTPTPEAKRASEKIKKPVAAKPPAATKPKATAGKTDAPIVTADKSLVGKVARFNDSGRFAVLEFPITHMPGKGRQLFVYRNGLKVGEMKVTGPQRDDRTVADLTAGEAQAGDEVRDQ